MSGENLCLFQLSDGTIVCTSCERPPSDSVYLKAAPEGLPEGNYQSDDPRLVDTQSEFPPESGPEV